MVQLPTVITQIEPEENGEYQIVNIEEFESPKKDKGLKVQLVSLNKNDKKDYSTVLWFGKEGKVTMKSKLGAFIVALSEIDEKGNPVQSDWNTWNGRKVRFIDWEEKSRRIKALD